MRTAQILFTILSVVVGVWLAWELRSSGSRTATKEYRAFDQRFTSRDAARRACQQTGGDLASIASNAEHAAFVAAASRMIPWREWLNPSTLTGFWHALEWHDHEPHLRWVTTGLPSYFFMARAKDAHTWDFRSPPTCGIYFKAGMFRDGTTSFVPCRDSVPARYVCEYRRGVGATPFSSSSREEIPRHYTSSNAEQAFALIQPHAVASGHAPIVKLELEKLFHKTREKEIVVSQALAEAFIGSLGFEEVRPGTAAYDNLLQEYVGRSVVALVFEAEDAVYRIAEVVGTHVSPPACEAHTLRRAFGVDSIRNAVYVSPNSESVKRDIALWLGYEEKRRIPFPRLRAWLTALVEALSELLPWLRILWNRTALFAIVTTSIAAYMIFRQYRIVHSMEDGGFVSAEQLELGYLYDPYTKTQLYRRPYIHRDAWSHLRSFFGHYDWWRLRKSDFNLELHPQDVKRYDEEERRRHMRRRQSAAESSRPAVSQEEEDLY